jgi:tRNA/rRNA methyltransferase
MVEEMFEVVLVEPRYDGNIGSVARIMKNFGFKNLVLVNPPEIGPEGRRNSMHAREVMEGALIAKSLGDIVDRYDFLVGTTAKLGGDTNTLRSPVYPSELSTALESKGKIGILFGREDNGLLNEELEQCDLLITIPANREYPTLNLAQSAGIILYEISKQGNEAKNKLKKLRQLKKIEKDYMLKFYDELVEDTYPLDFERNLMKRTFRNITGRAFISSREAKTLMGLFRKLKGK